jgi:transglutaminase-like putative cysteine protease/Tfp pilus assembly protein PilF
MALWGEIPPEIVGRLAGSGVIICLLLAGILKCVQLVRRPTTHSVCASALLIVLVGLLSSSILALLFHLHWLPFGLRLALSSITLACYVAGFVAGTIGLIDFHKNRSAYAQGTAQAMWAIGLSTVLALLFGTTLYFNLGPLLAQSLAASPQPAETTSSEVTSPSKTVLAENEVELKRKRVLDEFNLAFYVPDIPWVEVEARQLAPGIAFGMEWREREVTLLLVPERVGIETALKIDAFVARVKANGKNTMDGRGVYNQREQTYNGIAGVRFEADGMLNDRPIHKAIWVATKNGFAYQVHVVGPKASPADVNAALDDMCRRLKQVEPELVAHSEGFEPATDFESAQFGYRVELADTNWSVAAGPLIESLGAEYAARYGEIALLAILPVQLADRETDLETLTSAVLNHFKLSHPGPNVISVVPFELGKQPGCAIEFWDNNNTGKTRALMHLIPGGRRALLVCGWIFRDDAETRSIVEEAIAHVTVTPEGAAAKPSLSAHQRSNSALINNHIGNSVYIKNDFAAAIEYFKFASELQPEQDQIFANYIDAILATGQSKEALAAISEQVEKRPSSPLRALQAKLLVGQGDPIRARRILAELFANGYFNESDLLTFINLAIDAEAFDEALGVVEIVMKRQPTVPVRRWRAAILSRKGEHDKAIESLQKLRKEFASDAAIATELAEVYELKGDFSAAIDITRQLIDSGRHDEAILLLQGRNQMRLHWYSQAKQTFEKALAANPSSSLVKDYLAQASNLLGEGDNSLVKTPLEPVEIPELIRTKINAAKQVLIGAADQYDATEALNITGIEYRHGKPLRTTRWREVNVHTTGGVTRFSSLSLRFDPGAERVFVNRLAVFDAAGKKVAEGSVNDYYVLDDNSSRVASQKKFLNLPVPGLKPGYTLRYVVTTQELTPADDFRFQEFLLTSSVPVGVCAAFVHGDVTSIVGNSTPLARVERAADLIYSLNTNPEPYSWESAQPLAEYYLPILFLGESAGSWEEVGRAYLEQIKDKLVATDEARRVALELTKNCPTKREKIAALASHVQNTCTYQAIEFGRRARIPNPAAQTLHLKYGDCKDHAVLLRELLRSVDIPAHLALANTASHLRMEMPSLDQFNHMVVYVPQMTGAPADAADSGVFLDCTDKDSYLLLVPPVGLVDTDLLVLDPSKPRVVRTGAFPTDAARLVSQRTIKVTAPIETGETATTEVDEHVTLNQFLAPALRNYLRAYEPAQRTEAVSAFFDGGNQFRFEHISIENLDEVDRPLLVHLKYTAPEAFHVVASKTSSKTLVGHMPSLCEKTYFQAANVQQRKSPFELVMPLRLESTVELVVPKGFDVQDSHKLAQSEQSGFTTWASRIQPQGNAIKLEYRARRLSGRHRAEDYPQYCDAMKKALGVFDRPLVIQDVGRKPSN